MHRRQVEQRTILLALTGSRGYGLATEQSDYDYRGVFVATKPYYIGFDKIADGFTQTLPDAEQQQWVD